MKSISINTDLSAINNHGDTITCSKQDNALLINFSGKSVPYIPFKWIKHGLKFSKQHQYIAHPIIISINGKNFYSLTNSSTSIKSYGLAFKILLKSLFK